MGVVKNKTMKNVVSFETAKALKAAGFPQPEPEVGQFWYNDEGNFFIVCYRNGIGVAFAFSDLESKLVGISFRGYKDLFFAPTSADLLGDAAMNPYDCATRWIAEAQEAEYWEGEMDYEPVGEYPVDKSEFEVEKKYILKGTLGITEDLIQKQE